MARRLVYDIAASLDGYIEGEEGDLSGLMMQGGHADAYMDRLAGYDAVVMGRRTYEIGASFGLKPGQRAYPHMAHHVFSQTLQLPEESAVDVVREAPVPFVRRLKQTDGGDIYLCGGGKLARALFDAGLVDRILIKLNPVVLGGGVNLFGEGSPLSAERRPLKLAGVEPYENGVVLLTYEVG
jgi:dihydrofolate reductase